MRCTIASCAGAWLTGLMASSCVLTADVPTDDLDEADHIASTAAAILGSTVSEVPLSPHGGSRGTYAGHVTPPSIVYGVRVSAGAYVDNIRFAWYQPRRPDNVYQSGDVWGNTPGYGGSGGTNNGWWFCPLGTGIIGLRGNAGTLVDRIGVICSDVNNPAPGSPSNVYSPLWGGSGGSWFGEDTCAPGRLVDSFNLRSGTYLENLQALCVNAH